MIIENHVIISHMNLYITAVRPLEWLLAHMYTHTHKRDCNVHTSCATSTPPFGLPFFLESFPPFFPFDFSELYKVTLRVNLSSYQYTENLITTELF